MRIFEISPGQKRQIVGITFDKFWERTIVPNCSEYLQYAKSAGERVLYRGSGNYGGYFRGNTLQNRQPKDSNKYMTKVWDHLLRSLGFTAIRSNSIFCTSDRAHAEGFGNKLYCIFPINGFKYTYSPFIYDIVIDNWTKIMPENLEHMIYNEYTKEGKMGFPYGDFSNSTSKEFLQGLKELIPSSEKIQNLTVKDLINPEGFQERYEFKNTDLDEGIGKGNEILISGQYYAIDYMLIDRIRKKLREI